MPDAGLRRHVSHDRGFHAAALISFPYQYRRQIFD
jgi:hypothetical protein